MFDGGAVLPTALKVNVAGVLLGSFIPLKENSLNSYVPASLLTISA